MNAQMMMDTGSLNSESFCPLKDKSGIDEVIVKKQPYQLQTINREFFPSFDASNFHKFFNESS